MKIPTIFFISQLLSKTGFVTAKFGKFHEQTAT